LSVVEGKLAEKAILENSSLNDYYSELAAIFKYYETKQKMTEEAMKNAKQS
jgi:hypothetical protein